MNLCQKSHFLFGMWWKTQHSFVPGLFFVLMFGIEVLLEFRLLTEADLILIAIVHKVLERLM